MRKTKLLTSIAALALVLGLGACTDNTEEEPLKTVLGAYDTVVGAYQYFSGEASGNYLGVTTSFEDAAEVTIEDLEEGGQSIAFVDAEGETKYLAWSDSTKVDIVDEPYAWYWLEDIEVYAAGSEEGRVLVEYEANPSIRAYAQNESNLANPHVYAFAGEPADAPELPEPEEPEEPTNSAVTLTEVSALTNDTAYYLGQWTAAQDYHLVDGGFSNYRLTTTDEFNDAVTVTAKQVTNGWNLEINGKTLYAYIGTSGTNTYFDLELVEAGSSSTHDGATALWTWNETIGTLEIALTTNESYGSSSYLEFYSNCVTGYAYKSENASSITNAAKFYTVAAD